MEPAYAVLKSSDLTGVRFQEADDAEGAAAAAAAGSSMCVDMRASLP